MQRKERHSLGATVSATIERFDHGQWEVLLQTKWKPEEDVRHSGLIEIPDGRVEVGEDIYTALKREVKEECGLEIQANKLGGEIRARGKFDEVSIAFVPFCGETFLGSSYVGFAFVCTASGQLIKKGVYDAKENRWLKLSELKRMLSNESEKIYSYYLSALKLYLEEKEKGNI